MIESSKNSCCCSPPSCLYLQVCRAQLGGGAVEKRHPAREERLDEEPDEVLLGRRNVRVVAIAQGGRLKSEMFFLVSLSPGGAEGGGGGVCTHFVPVFTV